MNKNSRKQCKVFPFIPDSVEETIDFEFEDGAFDTNEQVNSLLAQMFLHPESNFFFYHNPKIPFSPVLKSAERQNLLLLNTVERFYYKHPKHKNDYIKIAGNNPRNDWERELVDKNKEYYRYALKLSKKAKLDLEISYKKQKELPQRELFDFKPGIGGCSIDLKQLLLVVKEKFNKIINKFLN